MSRYLYAIAPLLGAVTLTPRAAAAQPADAADDSVDAGAAAPPAPDPDPDLDDIEDALGADAAEAAVATPPRSGLAALGSMMNPDMSFILDVAFAWFSEPEHLQTGGHDPTRTGFTLQQLELAIGKAVDPYFRFDGNLVFTPEGVEVEEAYATTLALPHSLQVRAGEMFTRFGRINSIHPHAWDFVDQPFAIGRVFGADGYHGPGVELSYLTPLPWFVEIVASATDPHGDETARSFLGESEDPIDTPLDVLGTAAIKQFFELGPDWSLMWGLSGVTGPNAFGPDKRSDVLGTDVYLKWRPITHASDQMVAVQSEWLYRRRKVLGGSQKDLSGYAYAVWKFAKRWAVGARWEYGSAADGPGSDELDPEWIEARQRITSSLTFYPTEFSRLRLQTSVDRPAWRDPIWAGFLALEVSAGMHGAHKF